MKRDVNSFAARDYDVIVVGGGIYGACVARDAALRGLSVLLLERDDFGAHTSHNSLKLVHGGFRYIQHLDFRRMRQSVRERRAWLRIAPHLVRPLKFAMHTFGHTTRGPEALWVATKLHGLIGYDRNQGLSEENRIPAGSIVSRSSCEALMPGFEDGDHNGCAYWYDGQMQDADRLLIECIESAVAAGANVANYAEVTSYLAREKQVTGVSFRDRLSDSEFKVNAAITINTCGPWADQLQVKSDTQSTAVMPAQPKTLSMNLVVRKDLLLEAGIAVKSKQRSDSVVDSGGRLFFITPWCGLTIIGTTHDSYNGAADDCEISDSYIQAFIDEVNAAYPCASISFDDVAYCYWGLTPGEQGLDGSEARRARHGHIIDHDRRDGRAGLISVVGVKWTTARLVAEQTVDLTAKKLGRKVRSETATTVLPGASGFESEEATIREILRFHGDDVSTEAAGDLAVEYGSGWPTVMGIPQQASESEDDLFRRKARLAVHAQMAVRLADVLMRRTNLLQRGKLTQSQVDWCTQMMRAELGWSAQQVADEITNFEVERKRAHASVL